MNPMPEISVLLPVFNARRYLAAAVQSILNQTFSEFELIAVDDGSTDGSLEVLRAFARRDSRVRVISRANTGIVGALNDAVDAAHAPILASMDADDLAFPERLARQRAHLNQAPDVVLLGSAVVVIDPAGRRVRRMPRPLEHDRITAALLRGDGGALIHPAVLLRADACRRVGAYRLAAQFTEDLDLFLRLAEVGRAANLAEPLLYYRMHPTSVNFTRRQNKRAVKEWVLRDAYQRRGLPWDGTLMDRIDESWRDYARLHREWAVDSLEFSGMITPLKHAFLACRARPGERQSWRTLSYVLRALARREAGRMRHGSDPVVT
jgi:glycosyltransferase involved in cell wall biosynthesis